MSNLKIALLALAVVALGAVIFGDTSSDDRPATVASAVPYDAAIALPFSAAAEPASAAPASAAPAASAVPLVTVLAAPPMDRGNAIGRQLLATKNIKEFATDALKHPELGGAYYANIAVGQCELMEDKDNLLRRIEERDGEASPEVFARTSLVRDRCNGLTDEDIASVRKSVRQLSAEGKDPILAMQLRLREVYKDPVEFNRLLDEVFKSGNLAYASDIDMLNRMLTQKTTHGNDGTSTLIFNNKIYTDRLEIFGISLAARISLCNEGDYCAIDTEMANSCKNSGTCYASREEYIRHYAKDKPPQLMEYITRYTEIMRAAVARGDSSIFR